MSTEMDFPAQLHAALHDDPAELVMDYKGRYFTRGELAAAGELVVAALDDAGVPPEASVGVIVRNRPFHGAALLGLIAAARPCTSIYAFQSQEALAEEIASSRFGAVIADEIDWSDLAIAAATSAGSAGLALSLAAREPVRAVPGLERAGAGPFRTLPGEPGLEMLSSGTTGKPKRIPFPFRMLARVVDSTRAGHLDATMQPDIRAWPYGGIGGMCGLVANTMLNRYTVLLEKFNVPEWLEGVKRLRPTYVSGPPAVARMVLDAKVPREDIASIKYFYGGSAPMTPEMQDELMRAYGITTIWAYGATEFCGTIISWSLDLHERFGVSKKGAMGRALPGITLRVTDVETGEALPAEEIGYLEAMVPAVRGEEWIRTTDLAHIDADGFVFHHGRGDGAILRGGFKVIPETVSTALRAHPAVLDAGVVGVADPRLGQMPMAAVEIRSGTQRPTEAELVQHARRHLSAPHVPGRILILDALPRTTSLKVDLGTLKKILESEARGAS